MAAPPRLLKEEELQNEEEDNLHPSEEPVSRELSLNGNIIDRKYHEEIFYEDEEYLHTANNQPNQNQANGSQVHDDHTNEENININAN